MQITFMPHGKPVMPASRWLAPCEMGQWIAQYDQATVQATAIPANSVQSAGTATVIMASTLPRAQSSALALGYAAPRVDPLFCEAQLPFPQWRLPCLPPLLWAALFRLAWLFGYTTGAESLAGATARAKAARDCLIAAAAQGPVLLIGHGVMNRLIERELRAAGWTGSGRHGSGYWATASFHSP